VRDGTDAGARVISFVPGPSHVRDDVLAAMAAPPVPHRSDAFRQVVRRVQRGLGLLLGTASPAFPVLGSATTGVELALRGVARSRVLVVANGSFGERMAAIAAALGLDVETLSLPAGEPVDADLVARSLAAGSFDTVGFVHVETSTGAISDAAAIADAVRARPGTALVVDAVSSLGGVEVAFDRLGPEAVLVAATGKALACPPGMAIVAAAPGAVERANSSARAGFALSLARLAEFHGKGDVPHTPNEALYFALDRQLAKVLAEGMPTRAARHREMAGLVQTWAGERFAVLARDGARSPTVTAVENTRGIDVARLLAAVERRGFRIADGHGALAGATFRVGHMGDVTVPETRALLAAMDEALREIR
jgi:aspartate aminotransferase-like enzyme